jgi:hypothetical protein
MEDNMMMMNMEEILMTIMDELKMMQDTGFSEILYIYIDLSQKDYIYYMGL